MAALAASVGAVEVAEAAEGTGALATMFEGAKGTQIAATAAQHADKIVGAILVVVAIVFILISFLVLGMSDNKTTGGVMLFVSLLVGGSGVYLVQKAKGGK